MIVEIIENVEKFRHVKIIDKSRKYYLEGERNANVRMVNDRILCNKENSNILT